MTPTRKGLYTQCSNCLFKNKMEEKYPCILSHKEIRRNSGSNLERNFKSCGINDIRKEENEEEIEIILSGNQLKLF